MRPCLAFVLSVSSMVAVLGLATACGDDVARTASELPDAATGPADTGAGVDAADSGGADSGDAAFDGGQDAGVSAPTIASVTPAIQTEGSDITITGTNFGEAVEVKIRDLQATIVSVTATEVVVTVPEFPEIQVGSPVPSPLVVRVPGHGEATYSGIFRVRGK